LPVIGVSAQWDDVKRRQWIHTEYLDSVGRAGGLPFVLPLTTDTEQIRQVCRTVDGVLFTGGEDVFPGFYGEETVDVCGAINNRRDEFETLLFQEAVLNADKPALGICRGIQLINVMLHGTLYQDLPSLFSGKITLGHWQEPPYDKPSHNVEFTADGPLRHLFSLDAACVNSSHHQGIKDLAPDLECMALTGDGLIEAVRMPGRKFVWGVQWHPERTPGDGFSPKLFEAFVNACSYK